MDKCLNYFFIMVFYILLVYWKLGYWLFLLLFGPILWYSIDSYLLSILYQLKENYGLQM